MRSCCQPLYVDFYAQNVIKNVQPPWVTYIIKYIFVIEPFSSLSRAFARIHFFAALLPVGFVAFEIQNCRRLAAKTKPRIEKRSFSIVSPHSYAGPPNAVTRSRRKFRWMSVREAIFGCQNARGFGSALHLLGQKRAQK
jgi:hypothetical protein